MAEPDPGSPSNPTKFGAFTGVFTPTLLTILGVILYVRLGWVVGNAGLAGALLVLGLAMGITICTGLSLSSIATNTRLGAGGPYAMIKRSLGLEVGASIGVPLYLSRPLGIAMYIFGFREGWQWIFPSHDALIIDMVVFVALFGLAYLSAGLAFRIQYLIMAVIALSLVMIFASSETTNPSHTINWWGDYPGFKEDGFSGASFWIVFAVFFPATTGILAGANMSGDLKDPRKAIASGTLWAIAVSAVIYFAVAWWVARVADPETLVSDYNIIFKKSFWGYGVLAGLLGATFSSALAGAVGGPRILMAMAEHKLVPYSGWLAKTTNRGEPRNAVAITALLTFGCVMFRELNAIAPLVTMFFLITYLTINVVLLVESSLGLASFRPTLVVPRIVPLAGAIGCVFCMFIINPTFGLISVGAAIAIYIWVSQRKMSLSQDADDARSSIFFAFAEWAAAKVEQLGGARNKKAWKPNLLVPVEDTTRLRGEFHFLVEVCKPEGSIELMGIAPEGKQADLEEPLRKAVESFREEDAFCRSAIVGTSSVAEGVMNGLEALQGAFFRPNILFLTLPRQSEKFAEVNKMISEAKRTEVGVMLLGTHPQAGFGQRRAINLYVRPHHTGWSVDAAFTHNNLDLTLLMGYRLMKQWKAKLTLITVIDDEAEREQAAHFLSELKDLARFPNAVEELVMVGPFLECAANAPQADLGLFGLAPNPDYKWLAEMILITKCTCLYVADSGRESARA